MAGKQYEVAFKIDAKLAAGYTSAFSSAASTMGELQKRAAALSKSQANMKSFESLKGNIAQTSKQLEAAAEKFNSIKTEIGKTAQPTEAMKNEFAAAEIEVRSLAKSLEGQKKKIGELRVSLTDAGVDTRNFATEQARLAAQSEKLAVAQARMQQSQGAVQAARNRLSWNNVKGELAASAGIALALGVPIKAAANFEQAMAKTGAVLGANEEDMRRLSEQARTLGRDTQFTATQASQSQEMLARAGFDTGQILASMPGMLNMAAAEGMDLASAADIASSTLRGFNMAADQSNRVADVLAKASAATNSSISSLGESMKMVAPIAQGLNIPFEDTAAMIGVMANAGIKGSESGTALRAALLRLSKEPKQTAEALSKLGVATRDANGNLRTMPSLMKALSASMKGMGKADQMENLSKIFGTEAASGMLAIMNAMESGDLSSITEQMYNASGAAATMAARMNDTAQGALKRLSSASESAAIDVGNVLLPSFTDGVEKLASFTASVSQFAQSHPTFTGVIVKSAAALGAFKIAMTAGSIASTAAKLPFLEAKAVVDKVRTAYVLADGSLIGMVKNTKLVTGATKIYAGAQAALNAVMAVNPIILIVLAVAALVGAFVLAYNKCEWFRNGVNAVCSAVAGFFANLWEGIKSGAARLAGWFTQKWDDASQGIENICKSISGFFSDAFAGIADKIDWVYDKWNSFKNFLGIAPSIPIPENHYVPSGAGGPNGNGAVYHARGGIFSTPHIGIVAEAGREAILPIDDPARGIPLWKAAGRMMGLDGFGVSQNMLKTSNVENRYSFSFTIQGNAESGIEGKIKQAVMEVLGDIAIQNERLVFAQ